MRLNSFEIFLITAIFIKCISKNANAQSASEASFENSTISQTLLKSSAGSKIDSKNVTAQTKMEFWMRKMRLIQDDLLNVQAIIVKDEDLKNNCEAASRKSNKRYLMCAGSILNRNHVITSATCVHEATHIRHNIRAKLAVVIAPLKKSMQVIPVVHYVIHPNHQTNPYSQGHLKHNIAILTLSCRIDMVNYQKIELPPFPLRQTCSEENCIVAVFRRTGRTTHVMFQMIAPYVLYVPRRRKETSVQDLEHDLAEKYARSRIMVDGSFRLDRPKRKLAEPPSFMGKYESKKMLDDDPMITASETTTESFFVKETTSVAIKYDNMSSTSETSLEERVSKALREPEVVVGTVKSFAVRSSQWYLPCAHTGAPVMLKHVQAALVAIPCNGRQPKSKWYYTDLYDNADWIRKIIHEISHETMAEGQLKHPLHPGNGTGCSTCIFNFFIDIGCKDKGNCGKNVTTLHVEHSSFNSSAPSGQNNLQSFNPDSPNSFNAPDKVSFDPPYEVSSKAPAEFSSDFPGEIPANPVSGIPSNSPSEFPSNSPGEMSSNPSGEKTFNSAGKVPLAYPGEISSTDRRPLDSSRRNMAKGCTRNSAGIEIGQRCDKTDKKSYIRPIYRTNSGKTIGGVGKMKHLLEQNNRAVALRQPVQLRQPVTGRTLKTPYRNYFNDKTKYPGKGNIGISTVSRNFKKPSHNRNFYRGRATNEIGLQNIEADSTDWLSGVEKKLELSSEFKNESVKSRRSNSH